MSRTRARCCAIRRRDARRRRHCRRGAARLACVVAVTAIACPRLALAISERNDVDDNAYILKGGDLAYQSVGKISFLFGFASGSGTLITPKWVLTAAHVVDSSSTSTHTFQTGSNLQFGTTYSVASYFPHPSWNRNNILAGYDIGLMKLTGPVTNLIPASRYTRFDEVGQIGTSVGYGVRRTGSNPTQSLDSRRRGGQNVIDRLGQAAYGASNDLIASDFDDPNNADGINPWGDALPLGLECCVASGDSGGSVWLDRGTRSYAAAVHSFVEALDPPNGDNTDDSSYGDTYGSTRVSSFNSWIDDQVTVKWSNAAGGSFGATGNWTGGVVPDAYDAVGLNTAGTFTVTFSGSVSTDRLIARAGSVTLNLGSGSYSLTSGTYEGSLIVGRHSGNVAALGITNGTLNTNETVIADAAGSSGVLVVGPGATWACNGDAYVGGSFLGAGGTGAINLLAGGATQISGKLTAYAAGTVNFTGGTLSAGGIDLRGGGKMLLTAGRNKTVRTVTLAVDSAGGSRIDLSDNRLIATSASIGSWNGSAYTGVTGLIATGRAGGAWTGGGIVTRQSAAKSPSRLTTLGAATAGDLGVSSWYGSSVASSDVLVLYTYAGDADLNGKINGDDYFRIDSHVGQAGGGWSHGDFDYNGKINGDDYFIIDSNIAAQGPPIVALSSAADGLTAVPEPSAAALLLATPLALVPRRRRRHRRAGTGNPSIRFWSQSVTSL
jgi:hypothetical protein